MSDSALAELFYQIIKILSNPFTQTKLKHSYFRSQTEKAVYIPTPRFLDNKNHRFNRNISHR